MCGIAGSVSTNTSNQALIDRILISQHARGPDHLAQTTIQTNHSSVILGHNRLSILDLHARSDQPMWHPSNQFCVVFNGEIYNYLEIREDLIRLGNVFHTSSDTEVLLQAYAQWGIDCLSKFNGMFAFALYDQTQQKLWLARDRFGVKPLFYFQNTQHLVFASSSREIAKHFQLQPNLHYIARGQKFGYYDDASAETAFEKLRCVPASHVACIDLTTQSLTLKKYYDFAQAIASTQHQIVDLSEQDLLEKTKFELERAVSIRLRSDVKLALSLSGGLDSSTIAALAKHQQTDITAYSFGHPEARQSEAPLVVELSKRLNIPTQFIWPTQAEMNEAFWKTLDAQDAPFRSFSIVAQNLVYNRVHQDGVKVLLAGQGGDEGFLGYRKFFLFFAQKLLKQKQYFEMVQFLFSMLPTAFSELGRTKLYWHNRKRYQNGGDQDQVGLILPSLDVNIGSSEQRQILDITDFSLPTLLRYEDRNSMSHSVESRLPFLDYQLLELALALPETLKIRHGYGKWVLRDLMQNELPDTIRLARYKRGFDVPVKQWLDSGVGDTLLTYLLDNQSSLQPYLSCKVDIAKAYNRSALQHRNQALSEAITLAWLANYHSTG